MRYLTIILALWLTLLALGHGMHGPESDGGAIAGVSHDGACCDTMAEGAMTACLSCTVAETMTVPHVEDMARRVELRPADDLARGRVSAPAPEPPREV